jgi:hypothetical protein
MVLVGRFRSSSYSCDMGRPKEAGFIGIEFKRIPVQFRIKSSYKYQIQKVIFYFPGLLADIRSARCQSSHSQRLNLQPML